MEACATSVTLGNTVWAPRENAPLCIRVIRFDMDAGKMASGRSPSMETITTRRAGAAKVGVIVDEGVSVRVAVKVTVAVKVGVCVSAAVGVCEAAGMRVGVCVVVAVEVGKRKDIPREFGL